MENLIPFDAVFEDARTNSIYSIKVTAESLKKAREAAITIGDCYFNLTFLYIETFHVNKILSIYPTS